jgi:uncharacterized protein (DUF2141 family)
VTARIFFRFGVLVLLAIPISSTPSASGGIGVINAQVVKLRNNHGQVICTLFTRSDDFPERSHKGMTLAVPIRNGHATCCFKNLPYADYAIVAFHDENHDGEFNQNWLGLPKEGFGFSNNPGILKKPVFSEAKVTVDQPIVEITIKLNYWF